MNKRTLRLEKFGISDKRFKELCGFCEQYPEWQNKILEIENPIKAHENSGMPTSKGISDTTARTAIKAIAYREKIDLIERTARRASNEVWEYIILSVCYNQSVTYLQEMRGMCLEKSAFYEKRRYFFYLLDKAKEEYELEKFS